MWARGAQPVAFEREGADGLFAVTLSPRRGTVAGAASVAGNGSAGTPAKSVADVAKETGATSESDFASLRRDLRTLVERVTAHYGALDDWRSGISAELVQSFRFAAAATDDGDEDDPASEATRAAVQQSVGAAVGAARIAIHEERAAHLRATESMITNLLGPLLEECHQTRTQVAEVAAKVELLPAAIAAGVARAVEEQGDIVGARIEQVQRELAKVGEEALLSRLKRALDGHLRALRESVAETVTPSVEVLPEILVGVLAEEAATQRRQLLEHVDGLAKEHRQALAATGKAAARRVEHEVATQAAVVDQLDQLVDRLTRRLNAAQKKQAQSVDPDSVMTYMAEVMERVDNLQKLARSIEKKAVPPGGRTAPGPKASPKGVRK